VTAPELKLPAPFAGKEALGTLSPEHCVAQFEIGSMQNFVYLVIDWQERAAWVVDPQPNLEPWQSELKKHNLSLRGILLTHTHHDHVGGVDALLSAHPEISARAHQAEFHRLKKTDPTRLLAVLDQELIQSAGLSIRFHHTPGHTAGALCMEVRASEQGYLLTGDTLFIESCGRTDLPTGSDLELYESVARLRKMDPKLVMLPGHHYHPRVASLMEQEFEHSPTFLCKTLEEFIAL
jgi:hydroxyacylglutathione hydrolase